MRVWIEGGRDVREGGRDVRGSSGGGNGGGGVGGGGDSSGSGVESGVGSEGEVHWTFTWLRESSTILV